MNSLLTNELQQSNEICDCGGIINNQVSLISEIMTTFYVTYDRAFTWSEVWLFYINEVNK